MCGIVGIISARPVAEELYSGLFSLQHRGQDAAGIMTLDEDSLCVVKEAGLVKEVFSKESLQKLRGKAGIGHVRYPTAGSAFGEPQPFAVENPGLMALAHNGNISNHSTLRAECVQDYKAVLSTDCDSEVLLKILSQEFYKQASYTPEAFFQAVQNTMKKINGSCSVVGFTPQGLFAFRDPCGIRPLILASRGNTARAFASETVATDILGYKTVRDVRPGECIFITNDLRLFSKQCAEVRAAHCMFEWVYFARADSVIENRSVYETRLELGRCLANAFLSKALLEKTTADVVMPVPDTSRPAAAAFSDATGIPNREGLIKNRYADRTFIMPSQDLREHETKMKLNPIIHEVHGKRIALIDDSLVRGTTSKRIIQALKKAGASQIHLFLTCPPIKHQCPYGIDMATRGELAAANKPLEQIRQEMGVDSLWYQTIDALKQAIAVPLCTACLDGKYPTGLTREQLAQAESQRAKERSAASLL